MLLNVMGLALSHLDIIIIEDLVIEENKQPDTDRITCGLYKGTLKFLQHTVQ